MAAFVGYYRVSTQAQGRSGLGLDAQRAAVAQHVAVHRGQLVAEFEEVESGARRDRPRLQAALQFCKARKATLVIAKIDRLARNVAFVSRLYESGVDFVAADMPQACKLTIHVMAAMAEHERDLISKRTRESLAAAKKRGVELGNPEIATLSAKGVAANKAAADEYARRLEPMIRALMASGITSYARLAAALDATGLRTQRGKAWTPAGVRNVVIRLRGGALSNDPQPKGTQP